MSTKSYMGSTETSVFNNAEIGNTARIASINLNTPITWTNRNDVPEVIRNLTFDDLLRFNDRYKNVEMTMEQQVELSGTQQYTNNSSSNVKVTIYYGRSEIPDSSNPTILVYNQGPQDAGTSTTYLYEQIDIRNTTRIPQRLEMIVQNICGVNTQNCQQFPMINARINMKIDFTLMYDCSASPENNINIICNPNGVPSNPDEEQSWINRYWWIILIIGLLLLAIIIWLIIRAVLKSRKNVAYTETVQTPGFTPISSFSPSYVSLNQPGTNLI